MANTMLTRLYKYISRLIKFSSNKTEYRCDVYNETSDFHRESYENLIKKRKRYMRNLQLNGSNAAVRQPRVIRGLFDNYRVDV